MQHQISLPPNYSNQLKDTAKKLGVSKSEVVRRALDALELEAARRGKELKSF